MYTRLERARELLAARVHLRHAVEEWWKKEGWPRAPIPTEQPPLAVTAREVATFRYEDGLFAHMALRAGLKPSWFDLTSNAWSHESGFKLSLVQPRFVEGRYADESRGATSRLCSNRCGPRRRDRPGGVDEHGRHPR